MKTTVFLQDLADFPSMNEVFERAFAGHKPARPTVQVARLPRDVLMEIDSTTSRARWCKGESVRCA
jgi:2-iminobutanoate/2-iminopropanoate deaminase